MDKKHDEVESLAAFLHSGENEPSTPAPVSQVKNDASMQTEKQSISAPKPSETVQTEKNNSSNVSLNDVLFSLDSKRKKNNPAKQEASLPKEDVAVIYDDEDNEEEELPEIPDYTEDDGHYDDAATQMMNIVSPPAVKEPPQEEEAEEETEEEREERRRLKAMRRRYEKQRQHIRTFVYIIVAAFLCVGIIGVSAFASKYIITYALDLTGIVTNDFRIDVIIPEKATPEMVAAILSENNIISSPEFFKFFGEFTKKEKTFNAGTYTLSSTMSYMTIYQTLQDDAYESKIVSIRIVEGMTADEIAQILEENCICFAEDFEKYYKNLNNDFDFERRLSENSLKYNQLEGYLFPDTYEFYVVQAMEDKSLHGGTSDEAKAMYKNSAKNAEEAAEKIFENFNSKITRIMYKQMGEMNMSLDEVITLASMVQKEAASVEDMYYVASVFLNRIRNSEAYPKLQSDVTVLYVENNIKPYLTNDSIRYNRYAKAYNTYECDGIPAGPICNPGLDAIDAVLNAADTNYYFFCANEDTGEVFYAETQEQHEENLILAGLSE